MQVICGAVAAGEHHGHPFGVKATGREDQRAWADAVSSPVGVRGHPRGAGPIAGVWSVGFSRLGAWPLEIAELG